MWVPKSGLQCKEETATFFFFICLWQGFVKVANVKGTIQKQEPESGANGALK